MASSINASTSGAGGVITTADSSGVLNIQTAGTNAVTVDASQNVGIGTTTPSGKFHVANGDIYITNGYSLKYSATSYITPEDNSIGARISAGTITMWSGSTPAERMRIDSSGNLLLGTTTARGNFTMPSSGQIKPAGFTVGSGGTNNLGPLVTGQLAFASWNNGSGYALVAFQGTSTTLISSSNSAGGNNAFDVINNQSSNSGNGAAMFVSGGYIYFQTKVNFTAAGSVYILYLGG